MIRSPKPISDAGWWISSPTLRNHSTSCEKRLDNRVRICTWEIGVPIKVRRLLVQRASTPAFVLLNDSPHEGGVWRGSPVGNVLLKSVLISAFTTKREGNPITDKIHFVLPLTRSREYEVSSTMSTMEASPLKAASWSALSWAVIFRPIVFLAAMIAKTNTARSIGGLASYLSFGKVETRTKSMIVERGSLGRAGATSAARTRSSRRDGVSGGWPPTRPDRSKHLCTRSLFPGRAGTKRRLFRRTTPPEKRWRRR